MFKILLIILSLISLISCGSGNNSNSTNPTTSSNFLSAAPIDNATCDLFKINGGTKTGGSLQTVISDLGKVEFQNLNYSGPALI